MTAKRDCCVGEPCMGDPRGLHSLDCPVYLASMANLEARTQPRRVEPEPDTLSTSARLVFTEQRLAETERERDALVADNQELTGDRDELTSKSLALKAELVSARQETTSVRNSLGATWLRLDQARAQLAQAVIERDDARAFVASFARSSWIVARDGGRDCERCEHEIRRGEAYELLPGVDELRHIHCPNPTEGAPTT